MFFAKVPHCFTEDLPTGRSFTRLEAMFMYEVDQFNSRERTMREYAKIWSWSPGKVIRFIAEISKYLQQISLSKTIISNGTTVEQSQNSDGTAKGPQNSTLQSTVEQSQNSGGTDTEHVFIKREKREQSPSLSGLWNEVVAGSPLSSVREPISKDRQRKCITRLKERPLSEWREVFRLMIASPFLRGEIKDFKADFDWIMSNGSNAEKVLEGKYQNAGSRVATSDNRYGMFAGA